MQYIFLIFRIAIFFVASNEFWKANSERKLGFAILHLILAFIIGTGVVRDLQELF